MGSVASAGAGGFAASEGDAMSDFGDSGSDASFFAAGALVRVFAKRKRVICQTHFVPFLTTFSHVSNGHATFNSATLAPILPLVQAPVSAATAETIDWQRKLKDSPR